MLQQAERLFQRRTGARARVLRAIASQRGHFTAEELCQQLPQVGRATIYRTLARLVREGLLCKVLLEGDILHYRMGTLGHHHHLVCVQCDAVQDIETCDVTDFARRIAAEAEFELLGHRLEVYGRCLRCRRAGSPPVSSAPDTRTS